jgi:hypothetical protein
VSQNGGPLPGRECLARKEPIDEGSEPALQTMIPAQQYSRGNHVVCEELLLALGASQLPKGFVQVAVKHCLAPSRP